jgi:hypothetical protein
MKKTIKTAFVWARWGILLAPFAAMAQFKKPDSTQLPTGTLTNIITSFMKWALALLGVFAVIGFVIAGIMYLISAGNETMQEKAKKAMIYSIVGVVVGLIGYIVMQAVETWFGGSSTTF